MFKLSFRDIRTQIISLVFEQKKIITITNKKYSYAIFSHQILCHRNVRIQKNKPWIIKRKIH